MTARPRLHVMTYNIRHGRGMDGKVDLGRIAAVIEAEQPDLVALQEVDARRQRSGAIDQAEELAVRLGMEARFAPCIVKGDEHYGIATLSRLPLGATRQVALPHGGGWRSEPRCALVTEVRWSTGLVELELVNTHLSLRPGERAAQAAALATAGLGDDLILAGDLNCTPRSACYRQLTFGLRVAPTAKPSWPARLPILQLDHLLYRGELGVDAAGVVGKRLARRASDHLPVVASFHHALEDA
jgi:endonuclease/exonuclease/phosphatase family metal-dependent hydrolase